MSGILKAFFRFETGVGLVGMGFALVLCSLLRITGYDNGFQVVVLVWVWLLPGTGSPPQEATRPARKHPTIKLHSRIPIALIGILQRITVLFQGDHL